MRAKLLKSAAIAGALLAGTAALAAGTETARAMDQFVQVFAEVKRNYVDQVSDQQLIEGAIQGMLSSLDPHSSYVSKLDFDNLKIMTEGNYGGLGLTVSMEDGAVKVIAAQEDTPADRAGIKSGDYITHIDGKLLFGGTLDEAVSAMRGKAGTRIALTLVRPGRDKPIEVAVTREVIVQRPVKWEVKGDVGYININSFSESTGADTRAAIMAIDKALGHRPLGYVVDLRENGGGLLTQAIAVSDAFLDAGEIVSQRGRERTDIERYYAKPGDDAHGLPVIVLTDSGTASASEIVAGALQDHHRAVVLGERTFGKGSVQTLLPLSTNTALRLTTARYYTPSGRSVQEGGIEPDIKVPQLSDPDYKDRPVFREADLRRHLINEIKADNAVLEEDTKTDPRFAASPDALKKQRIDDFQLWYALKTIARVGGAAQVAAVTAAMAKDYKPAPDLAAK
jgi:carboxyl-terminal processing protease